jgi:hypothetical protein
MAIMKTRVRGFIESIGVEPVIRVNFQFNPTQLTDKRVVNYATLNAPALLMPARQYTQGGDRTLSFVVRVDALDKEGRDAPPQTDDKGSIWPELNKYRAFLYPKSPGWKEKSTRGSFVDVYRGGEQQFRSPPLCLFHFGQGRVIKCVVTEVSITELLFDEELAPLRADVSLTLVEYVPYDAAEGS